MRVWLFLALAAVAAPARADLTATYVLGSLDGTDQTMKMEVATNGDIRADMNFPGLYMITRDGRSYFVAPGSTGPLVEDFEDLGAVMKEELGKKELQFCAHVAQGASSARLVPRETMTVAGRTGEAYGLENRADARPYLVI